MKTKSVLLAVLFLCACPASAYINFNDGQTHNIDYAIDDFVLVYVDAGAPEMYTTVNVLDGALITFLYGYENCRINVSGGYLDQLSSWDFSQLNVTGGEVNIIGSQNFSQVNVSGGSANGLFSRDSSYVNISGGSISMGLSSQNSSKVNISGGEIRVVQSRDCSQVDISGGEIEEVVSLYDESIVKIFGSDFAVDGQPFGFGELISLYGGHPGYEASRNLNGTLLSGELIDTDFRIGHDAKIILIPEPATVLLLGLGGLFLRRSTKG